jgi:hypothetical protein
MFTAIILACNVSVTQCKSFGTPRVFNTEKECIVSLANGRIQIEAQGWMVLDSHCYHWGQKA